jgi:hypothetical protein
MRGSRERYRKRGQRTAHVAITPPVQRWQDKEERQYRRSHVHRRAQAGRPQECSQRPVQSRPRPGEQRRHQQDREEQLARKDRGELNPQWPQSNHPGRNAAATWAKAALRQSRREPNEAGAQAHVQHHQRRPRVAEQCVRGSVDRRCAHGPEGGQLALRIGVTAPFRDAARKGVVHRAVRHWRYGYDEGPKATQRQTDAHGPPDSTGWR